MKLLNLILVMALFSSTIKAQTLEPKTSIYDVKINDINGKEINLESYKGKKILFDLTFRFGEPSTISNPFSKSVFSACFFFFLRCIIIGATVG